MKRILYDVPRWSIYMHREARGLSPVVTDDSNVRRFEDELFERLYAGGVELLPASARDSGLAEWAAQVHAACDALPDFARLMSECRGDAAAAAAAIEPLMRQLRPQLAPNQLDAPTLRRDLRRGCTAASSAVDELREAAQGLEQVAFGPAPGRGSERGQRRPGAESVSLARRIRDDTRLRKIALLAGRFKRIAAAKRRARVRHGADEIADIEQGGDFDRLLPSEQARLVHPRLRLAMLRDLSERRCLQYQLVGAETLGKGPLVVALDKSGSMDGPSDIWATAVAVALLDVAQRERRPFAMLSFDEGIKHEVLVRRGEPLPEAALFVSCGGGTDIAHVVGRGLDLIAQHPGAMRKADLVLITDGKSDIEEAAVLRQRAATLGVTILGFGIGIAPEELTPWCDTAQAVADLDRLDDESADQLFAG